MIEYAMVAAGAAIVSLIAGALIGAWLANKKLKEHYQEVRGEVVRLRKVAQSKLSGDDPDLNALLRKLNDAVNLTYKAVEALEDQGKLIRRKTEGGREVIASSQYIARMIDDFRGDEPEPIEPEIEEQEEPLALVDGEAPEEKSSPPLR